MPGSARKVLMLLLIWIFYAAIIVLFVRQLSAILAFSVFPVGVVAWTFGVLPGTISVVFLVVLNIAALSVVGLTDSTMLVSEIPGALALAFLAYVIGSLRDLREKLKKELFEREKAEQLYKT